MTDDLFSYRPAPAPVVIARQERDAALNLLEVTRENYVLHAREMARHLWRVLGRPISVVDIRRALPPPADIDPRVMGCILRAPEWLPVAFIESGRPECHNRIVRTFVRAD